jgi:hypothetical protein
MYGSPKVGQDQQAPSGGGMAGGLGGSVLGAYGLSNALSSGGASGAPALAIPEAVSVAAPTSSYQLAGTLGSKGVADLSTMGAAEGIGSGLLAQAPGTAGYLGMGAGTLPVLGVAAGALTGGLQGKGLYDVVRGKDLNLGSQLALAGMTGGTSLLYNPVKKMFESKKAGERIARKGGRGTLQDLEFMGPDSKSIYKNDLGLNFDIRDYKKNTGKDAYNIDFREGDSDQATKVGAVNAVAAAIAGKNGKLRSDLAGELYNANSSSGDFWENLRSSTDKAGGIDVWANQIQGNKGIKDADKAAFLSGLDSIYNVDSRNKIQGSVSKPQPKPVAQVKPNPKNPWLKGKK